MTSVFRNPQPIRAGRELPLSVTIAADPRGAFVVIGVGVLLIATLHAIVVGVMCLLVGTGLL